MISSNYNAQPLFILTAEPNQASLKTTCARIADLQTSKTRREERYSLAATLRWKLTFKTVLEGADFTALQTALRTADDRPVVCPFWPAITRFGSSGMGDSPMGSNGSSATGDSPVFTGGLKITWEPGWSKYEIHPTPAPATFTPSALAATAPLLWGRFDKSPAPELATTETGELEITLKEDGPAAYAIAPVVSPAYGPILHGRAWPLLNIPVNFDKTKAGGADVEVKRQTLGHGREDATTYYPQTPRRNIDLALRAPREEAAGLVALFHACGGTVSPLWFPGVVTPARLTADTSATDARITLDNAAALGGHKHLWIAYPDGTGAAATVILASGNTLTLDRAPGVFAAEHATLQPLLFGRFTADELTIDWSKSAVIESQFKLIEVPSDYGSPEGETHGVTLGPLGAPASLLEVSDPLTTWHLTNYEAPITLDGITYEPRKYTWDKITERINLDDGTCTIKADSWPGSPFERLTYVRRNQQLDIVIKQADLSKPGAGVETIWRGVARTAKRNDKTLSIQVRGIGSILDQRIPRNLDKAACWKTPYSRACGLNLAAQARAAVIVRRAANATYEIAISGNHAEHRYAGGWLARSNPRGGSPTCAILDSTAAAPGRILLTLDADIYPAALVNETITLYPGCDKSWAACKAFANAANFGGKRNKPTGNPAFVAAKKSTPSTSKK